MYSMKNNTYVFGCVRNALCCEETGGGRVWEEVLSLGDRVVMVMMMVMMEDSSVDVRH